MTTTKSQFTLAIGACAVVCFALLVSLTGYFRSVSQGGSAGMSEKRFIAQLNVLHDYLKSTDSPDEAKAAYKAMEFSAGFESESEGSIELKKIFGIVMSTFATKPKEAEPRFALSKKKELMEDLVNAYRKEIPHGDIRVRAAYLNILFDLQASLLIESDEAEGVFIKKNRERFDGLKSVVAGSPDRGLPGRMANIDAIFQSYDKGFKEAAKWRADKADALAQVEKVIPALARSLFSGGTSGGDSGRRGFLVVLFLSLVLGTASFIALYFGFKVMRMRSELKMETFLAFLRSFGSAEMDTHLETSLQDLRKDEEWAPMLAEAMRAQEDIARSADALAAVPRMLKIPFFVANAEGLIQHRNESAAKLFSLASGRSWGLSDLMRLEIFRPRSGEPDSFIENLRNSFVSGGEGRFELLVSREGNWLPFELTMSPINSGPLAGGKVFFWYPQVGTERVVEKVVEKVVERPAASQRAHMPAMSPMHTDFSTDSAPSGDIDTFRRRTEEREILWKTEVQALIDQVTRQQDVLRRLSEEVTEIRAGNAEAMALVRSAKGSDANWHDEVCTIERDLERWVTNRQRLLGDLQQQSTVLDKARKFEEQLRKATTQVRAELQKYVDELEELRQFAEAARVHSVNLSLVRDPNYWEYAARSRAFAHELARFTNKASELGNKVRDFLANHPGGALAAHLNAPTLDTGMLDSIREEQERVISLLRRWKESGEGFSKEGDRVLAILQDSDKKGAMASQLGETSMLINEQAKGNLERWN